MLLNNVPLPGQTLSVTRVPINQNFENIDTAFSVDHVGYTLAGQGQHNKISFPVQAAVPFPPVGIVNLYSQLSAFTNQPELVFAHQSGSTAPPSARTAEFTSAGWTNPGWARLPSGILIKWNSGISFGGNSSVTIDVNSVPAGSPMFTAILNIQVSTTDSNASYNNVIGVRSFAFPLVTFSKFGGGNPGGSVTIQYVVIGF